MRSRPDILVLGGGGVLGEAWMTGLLAGLEGGAGVDLRRCEYFVGTSAGSIVAARLAAGQSPRGPSDLRDAWAEPDERASPSMRRRALALAREAGDWAVALSAPVVSLSLAATASGGALTRAAALRAIGRGSMSLDQLQHQVTRMKVRFDGRLRIVAVNRGNGRRVVFGRPSSPSASVGAAVAASCSVPWLFAPVRIGGVEYVDGGVWSPTNLDAAPAGRGSEVLCLNPTASLTGAGGLLTGAGGLLAGARITSRSLVALEAAALRRRGATVRVISPDPASAGEMGWNLMSSEPSGRVLEAGYRQGRRLAGRSSRSLTGR
ncbi:MAG TPA: patatin-like phospholipase family protein [Solirubrobacteraceae bacterium]|nr:patatin-like phospholipase family protein [Solirubrobacteraceae bacterium]